jgi:hypothetical protein
MKPVTTTTTSPILGPNGQPVTTQTVKMVQVGKKQLPIPADTAHEFMSNTGTNIRKQFGQKSSAWIEAQKSGRRNISQQLKSKIPGLGKLWKDEAKAITVRDALINATSRSANRDIGGIGLQTGHWFNHPLQTAAGIMDRGSLQKSALARGINQAKPAYPFGPRAMLTGRLLAKGDDEQADEPPTDLAAEAPLAADAGGNFGLRPDGSPKGDGFLGVLNRPDGTGVMTEFSVSSSDLVDTDGKEIDFPTLVPTLTPEEVQAILTLPEDGELPEPIFLKALAHARERLQAGKSPFAEPGESPASPASRGTLRPAVPAGVPGAFVAKPGAGAADPNGGFKKGDRVGNGSYR